MAAVAKRKSAARQRQEAIAHELQRALEAKCAEVRQTMLIHCCFPCFVCIAPLGTAHELQRALEAKCDEVRRRTGGVSLGFVGL